MPETKKGLKPPDGWSPSLHQPLGCCLDSFLKERESQVCFFCCPRLLYGSEPPTPLGSLSTCCRHPAWDKVRRAAGCWQSEAVLRVLRFTTVLILQITKSHSKDLDLSTPTKKPKAVLSDNLTGTQRVHSKICDWMRVPWLCSRSSQLPPLTRDKLLMEHHNPALALGTQDGTSRIHGLKNIYKGTRWAERL